MKMKVLLSTICLLFCAFMTVASKKNESSANQGPVITLIAPAEGDIMQIGNAIHFDVDLKDDNILESYRIEIHDNSDGHSHTKANEGVKYTSIFDKTWSDIAGETYKQVHHHGIVIPKEAKEGNYHFIIYCKNKKGEESSVIRSVVLSRNAGTMYH